MKPRHKINLFAIVLSCLFLSGCSSANENYQKINKLPDNLTADNLTHSGKVESVSYTTRDYINSTSAEETKKCNVYLPFNYDSGKQYNIFYLLHGTDPMSVVHENTWLYTMQAKNILDNMIDDKLIDPIIVVTPNIYSYGLYGDDDMTNIKEATPVKVNSTKNFPFELVQDILPAVEGKYHTYSPSVDSSSLKQGRDHRALGGLSLGARITLQTGFFTGYEYFSCFGAYSSSIDSQLILDSITKSEYSKLDVSFLTLSAGIYDFAYNGEKKMYDRLLENEKFTKKNTEFIDIPFGYHSKRSWQIGFYSSLLNFFR